MIKENLPLHPRSSGMISPWQIVACVLMKCVVWLPSCTPRHPGRLSTREHGSPKRGTWDDDNVVAIF